MNTNVFKNLARLLGTTDSETPRSARGSRVSRRFQTGLGLEGLEGRLAPSSFAGGGSGDMGPYLSVTDGNSNPSPSADEDSPTVDYSTGPNHFSPTS
jgi:hypothetical protein